MIEDDSGAIPIVYTVGQLREMFYYSELPASLRHLFNFGTLQFLEFQKEPSDGDSVTWTFTFNQVKVTFEQGEAFWKTEVQLDGNGFQTEIALPDSCNSRSATGRI